LIDPEVIDATIAAFRELPEVDYCGNTLKRTYPIGMDTEVFSLAALERAHAEAMQQYEREHVTPYLYQHPELFRLRNVEAPEWAAWPELRLTVDEAEDLEMLRRLVESAGPLATLQEMVSFLRSDSDMAVTNSTVNHRHISKPVRW
jgi:spore coat polysaccharide biosynthesis protein SpsF